MVEPLRSVMLGVVMERRAIAHAWADHAWRAVSVIPGAPGVSEWRLIDRGPGWARYHAATLPLALYRGETEGYRVNLSQPRPSLYVVLHEGDDRPQPFLVTACPFEAGDYEVSGDEQVDAVAMPAPVAAFVGQFVATHHVERAFVKRKRTPCAPRRAGPARAGKGRAGGRGYG